MKILITGVAGFIGFHVANKLLSSKHEIVGIDNLNDYYDVKLKKTRLEQLFKNSSNELFNFFELDISNKEKVSELFNKNKFDYVINLAAQAGVRYSIQNPHVYLDSNISGFLNILESSKNNKVKHLIYASSSSVYGMNIKQPFSSKDRTDFPISLYAASKKSNELMAHTYSHLFNLPTTGLRFFTVYGEFGRPDMAYYKFTQKIINDEEIDVYNFGKMKRDFTYIDDIVEGLVRLINLIPQSNVNDYSLSNSPYKIYNIGNNNPVTLMEFINAIEDACSKKAKLNFLPMQPGDVPITYADIDSLQADIDFRPSTNIRIGIKRFVDWYRKYSDS